jgi:sensor histidine kinase YesM
MSREPARNASPGAPAGRSFRQSAGSALRRLLSANTLLKRLLIPYLLTGFFVTASTIYNIASITIIAERLNETYNSNARIFDLVDTLTDVLSDTESYLKTRSSGSLEQYYRDMDQLLEQAGQLNNQIVDSESALLQRNIRRMIETYANQTQLAISAKRGRNVEGYTLHYDQARQTYQYIVSYADRLNASLFQANYTEYNTVRRLLDRIQLLDVLIMGVILAINFFIVLLTALRITRPIAALAQRADQVAGGDLDVQPLAVDSHDEVNLLANAFNAMLVSLRSNVEQIRQSLIHEAQQKEHELTMENLLQVAQLKNLQAQINPHFLFNALNTGAQLAMLEGAERTGDFVEHIAAFYRYNIKLFDRDVSLAEEVRMVEDYIYIQKVRFGDRITYLSTIDPDCLDVRMPGLVLQPLVENAIVHGLKAVEHGGMIEISIAPRGEDVEILIRDNGSGIEAVKISQILGPALAEHGPDNLELLETNVGASGAGIGLSNVISRLRLYYHRDDVVTILSEPVESGTTIRLMIPRTSTSA